MLVEGIFSDLHCTTEGPYEMANVLVVDDDQAILGVIEFWLSREGHSIYKAPDGEAALDQLSIEKFDLMVTDIIMPKTEGIQLIIEIRKTYENMNIIAISSVRKEAGNYLDAAKKLGANTILSKPLEQASFVSAVNALLN